MSKRTNRNLHDDGTMPDFNALIALDSYQQRHPRLYAVEPLPNWMHTADGYQQAIIHEHVADWLERINGTDALMPW